jgi:hypothetical protein
LQFAVAFDGEAIGDHPARQVNVSGEASCDTPTVAIGFLKA